MYTKNALTIDQQIDQLKQRGLILVSFKMMIN